MPIENVNPIFITLIKVILYIIGFIIFVIMFMSIINYLLYAYYYIKELIITNETLYDIDSLRLKDIYNYKLINYIKIFNKQNEDIKIKIDNRKCYNIKNLTFKSLNEKGTIQEPSIVLAFNFNKLLEKNTKFITKLNEETAKIPKIPVTKDQLNKIWPKKIKLDEEDFNELSDEDIKLLYTFNDSTGVTEKIYGIYKNNKDFYFQIEVNEENDECDINDEYVYSINKSLYDDIKDYIEKNKKKKKNEIDLNILGKNGIFGIFKLSYANNKKKNDNFGDVFGYALNRLYLLLPNNLYNSYDYNSSNLYILTNNKLYELIFSLIFIIFLIIVVFMTKDVFFYIYNSINNTKEKKTIMETMETIEGLKANYSYIVISIIIVIYCIIHGIIYYYLFICGSYSKINELYNKLIQPDEIIRNDIVGFFAEKKEKSNKLLLYFQKIAYGNEIDIPNGKYSVIDIAIDNKKEQIKSFEEKMLLINKHFTYNSDIHDANIYTKEFFKLYKELYNHTATTATTATTAATATTTTVQKEKLINLLTIYIYIIEFGHDDPYTLIKLNKLIFGRIANIGIEDIDEDIDNILAFRYLIPYNTTNNRTPNIAEIYYNVSVYLDNTANTPLAFFGKSDPPNEIKHTNFTDDTKNKFDNILKFEEKFKSLLNTDTDKGGYYFNLYLAFEMGLNILFILIILIALKMTSIDINDEFTKYITYAQSVSSWLFVQIGLSIFGIINVFRFI